MTLTINKLKEDDMELIEMMIESFQTHDKIADVISRFAAKYHKTEGSIKMRWNRIRPLYVEIARERGLTDIVEDAERRSKIAIKNAEARKKNKTSPSKTDATKKTSIKKQELFDRFNKTDDMQERLEQLQQETLQHIQISHKSNDARFNGISSMLKLIAEKVEQPKQIGQKANGLVEMNKFGQVQAIEMHSENHLDEDKVLALIDAHEKLEDELKNEKDLRMTGEDLYDELKNEFNKMQKELDNTKNLLRIKDETIEAHKKNKAQLEKENSLLAQHRDQIANQNEALINKNKLLNKRGFVDRLFNRDVEYNPVSN